MPLSHTVFTTFMHKVIEIKWKDGSKCIFKCVPKCKEQQSRYSNYDSLGSTEVRVTEELKWAQMMMMVMVENDDDDDGGGGDDVDGGDDPHGDGRKCESLSPEVLRISLCLQ